MTIIKTTKTKEHYEKECPKCGKIVPGVSLRSVRHNFRMHKIFCKGKKEVKEQ